MSRIDLRRKLYSALFLLVFLFETILINGDKNQTRIAIMISGQLRTANLTWTSDYILHNAAARFFGPDDPPTPAATLVEFLFKEIMKQGYGLDVFMYIQSPADSGSSNSNEWDGSPYNYKPSPGDIGGCKIFSDNEVFKGTNNHFFCLVEKEIQLMNVFIRNFSHWSLRHPDYNNEYMNEQALQQYYGMYKANQASKQYSISHSIEYKYKIRLRPDTPLSKVFPNITSLNFGSTKSSCQSTVYYSNKAVTGHSDWFNIGLSQDMDYVLDRYVDFISTDFVWVPPAGAKWWYDLEDHFERLLLDKYKICVESADDIWMVIIRRADHTYLTKNNPIEKKYDWVDLST